MRLLSLSLEHFRNYGMIDLEISGDGPHFFVGPNGAGKTNLLESIGLLSLSRSFFGVDESDLVSWGQDFYRVRGCVQTQSQEKQHLELVFTKQKKACFFNDVSLSISNFVGMFPTVSFLPQDLDLFTGPPAVRRRFLDQLLCQVSPDYLYVHIEYQKVLKQRNALLRTMRKSFLSNKGISRGVKEGEVLVPWNDRLSFLGSVMTLLRLELIETLNCTFLDELKSFGESFDQGCIRYNRQVCSRTQKELTNEFLNLLEGSLERDLYLQSTSVGPHRDDWMIELNGRNIATFASRGQKRTCLLALLFLKVFYLELRKNEKPVVLLDDVFSELDAEHQRKLLNSFDGYQILITTTQIPDGMNNGSIWTVEPYSSKNNCNGQRFIKKMKTSRINPHF
jgi:DNA replication and repair protein RecF